MFLSSFEQHLRYPRNRGPAPGGVVSGSAGGAACGDVIRFDVVLEHDVVAHAGFDAEGCGALVAAGSACVSLVEGTALLDAARVGAAAIDEALGGLSAGKRHAADLAADALHRALAKLLSAPGDQLAPRSAARVVVGLSGGVDSAVAALLERERGHEVVAVTLKLWADRSTDGTRSCCSPEAVVSARALAHSLGFPHLTLDVEERFRRAVVGDYVREHERGRTPNPCVRCNGFVRFDAMLALADRVGAAALVTGHYARVERDAEGPLLARAADAAKDQTYMLAALRPQLLERVRFPLAGLTKPQVRQIARERKLAVAGRRESQDLCFLAGTSRERFLARHASPERPGEIVNRRGELLGRHRGHRRFTVGQRRGLGLGGGEPSYVLETDARANRVVVGSRDELATRTVGVRAATLYRAGARVDAVKLRYRSDPLPCSVAGAPAAGSHPTLTLLLGEAVHGAAAGQTACLLEGDRVVGHGTIAAPA